MGKIKSVAQLGADKKFGLPVPFSVDLEQIDISDNLKATLTQSNITVSEENMEAVVTELVEMAADQKTILDKVPVTKGGTGKNSITQGNILVGGVNNTFEEKGIDTIPTSGSGNLVSSGGVYTALSNLPPKNHASTTTEYGVGNNLGFGHVKISDDYKNTSAENGVAASHNALVNAYTELNNAILNSEGGGNNLSVDIPITLTSGGWTGTSAPYQQTVSVLAIREGMTPLFFLGGNGTDGEQYAFSLITGYSVANTEITFYAADSPSIDINIILKGIPAQKIDSDANGIVIVIVEPSAFAMNDETGRYEATVAVEGMTAGLGGVWDIVRSGSVLTEAESKIALNITDVERLDGAIRIVSLEIPSARFMMSIQGSPVAASDGDIVLSGMQTWFDRVETLEDQINTVNILTPDDIFTEMFMDIESSNIFKKGNTLFAFLQFTYNAGAVSNELFKLKEEYAPIAPFVIASIREQATPYREVASLWINSNGFGTHYNIESGKSYYIYFNFVI